MKQPLDAMAEAAAVQCFWLLRLGPANLYFNSASFEVAIEAAAELGLSSLTCS